METGSLTLSLSASRSRNSASPTALRTESRTESTSMTLLNSATASLSQSATAWPCLAPAPLFSLLGENATNSSTVVVSSDWLAQHSYNVTILIAVATPFPLRAVASCNAFGIPPLSHFEVLSVGSSFSAPLLTDTVAIDIATNIKASVLVPCTVVWTAPTCGSYAQPLSVQIDELYTIAQLANTIATTASGIPGILMSISGVATVARVDSLMTLARCAFDVQVDADILTSPTRLCFGPSYLACYRDAVVGNIALMVGVTRLLCRRTILSKNDLFISLYRNEPFFSLLFVD